MHQYADSNDQNEIVRDARVDNFHFFKELRRFLVVAIKIVAFQVESVEAVDSVQKAVKAGAEVGYVEHPSEHSRRVHVTDAKPEYREQYRNYGPRKHRDPHWCSCTDEEAPRLSCQTGGYSKEHEGNYTRSFHGLPC